MTVCKIIFHGTNLQSPIERLIKCFHELSKTPFAVKWSIDGIFIESASDPDLDLDILLSSTPDEKSSLTKHSFVLSLAEAAKESVGCIFQISGEPPFSLINHIHHIHRHSGLQKSELIYHSYRGVYGCHRIDQEGNIDRNEEIREEGNDVDQIGPDGRKAKLEQWDLDSSATFREKVPKGKFAKFLSDYGFEY